MLLGNTLGTRPQKHSGVFVLVEVRIELTQFHILFKVMKY